MVEFFGDATSEERVLFGCPLLMLGGTLMNFLPTLDYLLKGVYDSLSAWNITLTIVMIVAIVIVLRDYRFIGGFLSFMVVAIVPAINGGGFNTVPVVMILLFLGGITSISEALINAMKSTREEH